MSGKKASQVRVVMARGLARRWLKTRSRPEYRLTIYYGSREIRGIPNLLRSFRDGKIKMGSVKPLPDLGIEEKFDSFTVWSSDRIAMISLREWVESRGLETSGMW